MFELLCIALTMDSMYVLPQSHASAAAEFQCRGYISLAAKILSVGCLAVFALRLRGDLDPDQKQVRVCRVYQSSLGFVNQFSSSGTRSLRTLRALDREC